MNVRSLIPWSRSSTPAPLSEGAATPFLALHQEMNRLFDDVFRSFDLPRAGSAGAFALDWPHIEVAEKGDEVHITAELPGVDEKDVDVSLDDGVLCIRGEKRSEVEDRERRFTERSYGRFERRIPLGRDIDPGRVTATFRNGVLKVTAPNPAGDEQQRVKRIPINAGGPDPAVH